MNMNITTELWKVASNLIFSNETTSEWLRRQASLPLDVLLKLPIFEINSKGDCRPSIEKYVVAQDYLDFLQEQIKINARGPEWLILLNNRLKALAPYVGQEIVHINLNSPPNGASIRIHPRTAELIHFESW